MEKIIEELILDQLKGLREEVQKVRTEDVPSIRERVKAVEVKAMVISSLTGLVGGALTIVGSVLMKLM